MKGPTENPGTPASVSESSCSEAQEPRPEVKPEDSARSKLNAAALAIQHL